MESGKIGWQGLPNSENEMELVEGCRGITHKRVKLNCMYFTIPRKLTEKCMQWLYENCSKLTIVFTDKDNWQETSFVQFCTTHGITIIGYDEVVSYVKDNSGLDVIVSNIYPRKIEDSILALAGKAAFNIHPAPLPEYRGVFGYNFAMLHNDKTYGVTAHKLSDKFDEGDIIEVDRFSYDCGTGWLDELVPMAETHMFQLLVKIITKLLNGEDLSYFKQEKGSYYSLTDFENAKRINCGDHKDLINQKIRAFWYPPYEGAFVEIDGQKFTLVNDEVMQRLNG